jgi:hypothetical protein
MMNNTNRRLGELVSWTYKYHAQTVIKNPRIFGDFLFASWHTVEVESFLVHHSFGDIVFLFSFFEESAIIKYSLFDEGVDIFGWESLRREGFFILHVASALLIGHIETWLFVLISCIDKRLLLFTLGELTSSSLFFYETCRETVTVSHFDFFMERGTGFEPTHPRVEALVHSLFYVTPA